MVKCNSDSPNPIICQLQRCKIYYYCTCGKSEDQPFCDGSHKRSKYSPIKYHATEDKIVVFCGCKLTKNPPFCDGSHRSIDPDMIKKMLDRNSG